MCTYKLSGTAGTYVPMSATVLIEQTKVPHISATPLLVQRNGGNWTRLATIRGKLDSGRLENMAETLSFHEDSARVISKTM